MRDVKVNNSPVVLSIVGAIVFVYLKSPTKNTKLHGGQFHKDKYNAPVA